MTNGRIGFSLNLLAVFATGILASTAAFVPKTTKTTKLRLLTFGISKRSIQGTISTTLKMSTSSQSGFGCSTLESTKDAVSECITKADVKDPSIAFVSCTVARDVDEVRAEFDSLLPPNVPIHGITSSGSILTSKGSQAKAIGCLLVKGDSSSDNFATAYDPESGSKAIKALKECITFDPQVILMGATPGAEEGIIDELATMFPHVPVYGGTAADDALSGEWKVFSRNQSSGVGVSLVAISNNVKIGASMLGPYKETDKTAKATKTDGRRVFEIDGRPAADWVYDWLGEDVKEQYVNGGLILPQTAQRPIGIVKSSGEYVTNHLAAFGGEEKFVDFFAPIPEGAELVVMDGGDGAKTGYSKALGDAYDTAKSQGSMNGSDPTGGILVFCGGMAIAVGDKLDDGLSGEAFASKVEGLPMLGMTCFGEQAHLPGEKANVQRNLSVGMILLG